MSIINIPLKDRRTKNLNLLANTVYENFKLEATDESLNHNMPEIYRLLKGERSEIFLFIINKKIAGYIVGEKIKMSDGRNVFFITYLFTAKKFRNKKIGSQLLTHVETYAKNNYLNCLMLTCDSNNQYLNTFYLMKGFMPDLTFRTYSRYETLSKRL